MYVRDAKNRDEVWLLDSLDAFGVEDPAFRSRDYVIAQDEEHGQRAGFGRIQVHHGTATDVCELSIVCVLDAWRGQGVGAHIVERLLEYAGAEGFETVYAFFEEPEYFQQFGFDPVSPDDLPTVLGERLTSLRESQRPDAVGVVVEKGSFEMPLRLRERFKVARPLEDDESPELAEDFGIDTDSATYKYDTGAQR